MSIKFERDTVRRTTESAADFAREASRELTLARDLPRDLHRDLPLPGTSGKHPIAEKIGTAITGGKANAGTKGYLMVRLVRLPLIWPL